MEYTNRLNLPLHIFKALTEDNYTVAGERPSDYSITTIISPIQQTALKRTLPKSSLAVRDAVDNFHSFVGTAVHDAFERAWNSDYAQGKKHVVEKRLYLDIAGKTISGKVDNYIEPIINDFKTIKAYKIMKKDYKSWEEQLNCYAYLLRKNGYIVSQLTVTAIVMDWTTLEAAKGINNGYPQTPIPTIPIPIWTEAEQKLFIEKRISMLIDAETLNPAELSTTYPCSKEEQWSSIKNYAIIKNGNTKATKCFDEKNAAQSHLRTMKGKENYTVVERVSPRTRCLKYCDVASSCEQNKKLCIKEGHPIVKQSNTLF